jgi:hypothetical protein
VGLQQLRQCNVREGWAAARLLQRMHWGEADILRGSPPEQDEASDHGATIHSAADFQHGSPYLIEFEAALDLVDEVAASRCEVPDPV